MDILDDIFDTLGLKGALYFRTNFSGSWGVTVPELSHAARFHLVVQGTCHVTTASGATVRLGTGDLILIPGGRSHILADRPTDEAPELETILHDTGYDGSGVLIVGSGENQNATSLVCGHLTFRKGADHPMLRALPDHIVATAMDRAQEPLLDEILRLIARRMFSDDLGSAASVTRMSEIVFIEVLRTGIGRDSKVDAVMSAFRDQQIGRALQLIHEKPSAPWSVESLAAEVGMSRSRFADRFSAALGQGPIAYLTDWRLQKALPMLDDARSSVQEIAGRIGYQSPAAFTRAFAGKFGLSPRNYRRQS